MPLCRRLSYWEVHRKHQILPHLQLPLQDHPGPAVSLHQVPLRPAVPGSDDPSAGVRCPAGEVRKRGTVSIYFIGQLITPLLIRKCQLKYQWWTWVKWNIEWIFLWQHWRHSRWNESHCGLVIGWHEKITQHLAGTARSSAWSLFSNWPKLQLFWLCLKIFAACIYHM